MMKIRVLVKIIVFIFTLQAGYSSTKLDRPPIDCSALFSSIRMKPITLPTPANQFRNLKIGRKKAREIVTDLNRKIKGDYVAALTKGIPVLLSASRQIDTNNLTNLRKRLSKPLETEKQIRLIKNILILQKFNATLLAKARQTFSLIFAATHNLEGEPIQPKNEARFADLANDNLRAIKNFEGNDIIILNILSSIITPLTSPAFGAVEIDIRRPKNGHTSRRQWDNRLDITIDTIEETLMTSRGFLSALKIVGAEEGITVAINRLQNISLALTGYIKPAEAINWQTAKNDAKYAKDVVQEYINLLTLNNFCARTYDLLVEELQLRAELLEIGDPGYTDSELPNVYRPIRDHRQATSKRFTKNAEAFNQDILNRAYKLHPDLQPNGGGKKK